MSERKHHHGKDGHDTANERDDDRDEAIEAADDTGMVSNEANIIAIETEEHLR